MTIFKDAGYQLTVEILSNVGMHVTKKCAHRMRTSRRARRIIRGARFARSYASGGIQRAKAWRRDLVELDPEPLGAGSGPGCSGYSGRSGPPDAHIPVKGPVPAHLNPYAG